MNTSLDTPRPPPQRVFLRFGAHLAVQRADAQVCCDVLRQWGWRPDGIAKGVLRSPDVSGVVAFFDPPRGVSCLGRRLGYRDRHTSRYLRHTAKRLFGSSRFMERVMPLAIQVPLVDVGTALPSPLSPCRSQTVWAPTGLTFTAVPGHRVHCRIVVTRRSGKGPRFSAELVVGWPPTTLEDSPRRSFYLPDLRRIEPWLSSDDVTMTGMLVRALLAFVDRARAVGFSSDLEAPRSGLPVIGRCHSVVRFGSRVLEVRLPSPLRGRYLVWGGSMNILPVKHRAELDQVLVAMEAAKPHPGGVRPSRFATARPGEAIPS